jgi:hypothetical protein
VDIELWPSDFADASQQPDSVYTASTGKVADNTASITVAAGMNTVGTQQRHQGRRQRHFRLLTNRIQDE